MSDDALILLSSVLDASEITLEKRREIVEEINRVNMVADNFVDLKNALEGHRDDPVIDKIVRNYEEEVQ